MNNTIRLQHIQSLVFFLFINLLTFSQPASWQSRGVGGGGALFFPSVNPGNDNEFYISCDMSELFHTTDYGQSYSMIPFTKFASSNRSVYQFTNNASIAYCLATDGNIIYPVKTTDGGNTWNLLAGNPYPGDEAFSLFADYNNPNRVLLGFYGELYFSSNGGASFSLIRTGANTGAGLVVGGVFFDGSNIYIGTNDGVLQSTNGGTTFSLLSTTGIPAGEVIFSFAAARNGVTTRMFCLTADPNDVYNGIQPYDYYGFKRGIYSMDAGTNTWVARNSGITATDHVMYIAMAQNNINTVYLGGNDENTGGPNVMKTTNAGVSWSRVFNAAGNQNITTGWCGQGGDRSWGYAENCFGITVSPNNANKVVFGDFGFVHVTADGGASWNQAYVNTNDDHPANANTPARQYYSSIGLENTTAWQVHWQNANTMFACFSDIRGIRSVDGGAKWGFDYTGHNGNTMYRVVKHPVSNTMFAATSNIHDMYQSTRLSDNILDAADANGRIIYSSDNGATWQNLRFFNHPVYWIAMDPNNNNRAYASVIHYNAGAGIGGIYRCDDLNNLAASTWTKLPNPPRTEGHPASIVVLNDGKAVVTYSGRRNGAGTFTASSGVFLYDPAGNSWTDVSTTDMHYWTKDIIIDPADPLQNTWYVCVFSGWGGAPNGRGGLYKTTNRGASWIKLTGTQFDRVTSITFNPSDLNQAYLTTEGQGLWISNNMNSVTPTWTLVNNYPFRQPERVFFNPYNVNEVWVTSFGNGLKTGINGAVLPVRLLTFSGQKQQADVVLNWTTTNESTGDHFGIERSSDGRNFAVVAEQTGNGNAVRNEYRYTDRTVPGGTLYYRIRLISRDGRSVYSSVIMIKDLAAEPWLVVSPNPFRNILTVQIQLPEGEELTRFRLTDANGRIVWQQNKALAAGMQTIQFSQPDLRPGIYWLRVSKGKLSTTVKLFRQQE